MAGALGSPANPEAQLHKAIEPVYTLFVDLPAFTPQELMKPQIPEPHTRHGQFFQTHHERRLILGVSVVVHARPA